MNKPIVVMGVDPGFASMGVAILEVPEPDSPVCARMVRVVETKKASKETLRQIRVASDDQRRLFEFWGALQDIVIRYRPLVLGVEQWRPFPGQMGGNAWKVGSAVQVVHCLSWQHGLPSFPFIPNDLKRRFLGQKSGDKNQVGYAVLQHILGLAPLLSTISPSKHEHVYDAAGLAYLALEEWRRQTGVVDNAQRSKTKRCAGARSSSDCGVNSAGCDDDSRGGGGRVRQRTGIRSSAKCTG